MSTQSQVTIYNVFTGDVNNGVNAATAPNPTSPAEIIPIRLSVGNNLISAPVVTGITVTGLTIIMPAGNTTLITLKGVNADTGIPLHKTNPTYLSLDSTFVSLVLSVGVQIDGVRLVWS